MFKLAAPRPWRKAKAGVTYKEESSDSDDFQDVDSTFNESELADDEDYSISAERKRWLNQSLPVEQLTETLRKSKADRV